MDFPLKDGFFRLKPDYEAVARSIASSGADPTTDEIARAVSRAAGSPEVVRLMDRLGDALAEGVKAFSAGRERCGSEDMAETPSSRNQRAREIAGEAGSGPKPDRRIRR